VELGHENAGAPPMHTPLKAQLKNCQETQMDLEIFVPHNEVERSNCSALEEYLSNMFFC
jgi:hypothetical protein